MTFCVVFFFSLVSLISSDTAAPPPGIKVQITEKAKDVLKDLGLMYLKGLVNREFIIEENPIKRLTLTKLQVDPAQMDFRFQEKTGLQFEIKDLNFELQQVINSDKKIVTTEGLSATITVRMKQNSKGHLSVEEIKDKDCKINAETIRTKSTDLIGKFLDNFKSLIKHFFIKKICPALQPMINDKLKDLFMIRIHEDRQLDLDFSLSKDIAVTSSSFDISFKGLFTVHGQAVDTDSIRPGKEPVFTETSQMIYVGFSEFFFNVAAMAIYKSGPFVLHTDILKRQLAECMPKILWDTFFYVVGIASGQFEVELTKAPDVHISENGLSATVDIEVKSDGQQSLRMTCRDNMNVEFKGRHLIPVFQNPKCEDTIGAIKKRFQTGVVNTYIYIITKLFVKEIPIPLPAELSIIDAKTRFEGGYLVVEGSLTFNPQSSSNAGG